MQFAKRLWKNKPDNTTSIDAANLNRIEAGLADAADELGTKANAQAVSDALAGKLSQATADTRYVPVPGSAGTTGQVLAKTSTGTAWIAPPSGGGSGGTNLTKNANTGMYAIGAGSTLTKNAATGMYPIGV